MRITFLMSAWIRGPSGGFKVVYEYANQLVARGHKVAVVHPRCIDYPPAMPTYGLYWVLRKAFFDLLDLLTKPTVNWHHINKGVELLYVPNTDVRHIPDGDAIFATEWRTVHSVLEYPLSKGEKCYLIQGYETWQGPRNLVDATWHSSLHKVVIAKWLLDLGKQLGCSGLTYIPNAIDHKHYRLIRTITGRHSQLAMVFSSSPVKGSVDGIEAIRIVREKYPNLKVVAFGTSRRQSWVPRWVEYHRNPPQDIIVQKIYNNSSIFLCPSLSEGFGFPSAEAAACGCAVVATDSGGVREFIEHGITGLLSPPQNPVALAKNICQLLNDEGLRVRLAEACNRSIQSLSWQRSAALLEKFITTQLFHRSGANARLSLFRRE